MINWQNKRQFIWSFGICWFLLSNFNLTIDSNYEYFASTLIFTYLWFEILLYYKGLLFNCQNKRLILLLWFTNVLFIVIIILERYFIKNSVYNNLSSAFFMLNNLLFCFFMKIAMYLFQIITKIIIIIRNPSTNQILLLRIIPPYSFNQEFSDKEKNYASVRWWYGELRN